MIKKIIACSDIHIRNLRRQEEYVTQLKKFISDCQKMADDYGNDSIRIIVAGDILHNKLDISGEGYTLASWFLGKLDDIAETIVIAGNHDMNMSNTSRMDPLSAIFKIHPFKQTIYLDQYFEYSSGCYVDDNIVWCLYSSFENFAKPNIEEMRIKYPENTFIALFHGELKNAKTDTGYVSENGRDAGFFEGVDFGILGHIHKRQCIRNNGVPLVYCGSLIQQDHGENISAHGYVVWDVEEQDYEEIDIPNEDYGFYTFSIKNIDDIEENKEEIINL